MTYPYETATEAERALGTWWVAIHHETMVERLTEPPETRAAYIRKEKPAHEIETRLRAFRPASPAMIAAWAEYERVSGPAEAEYQRVRGPAWVERDRVRGLAAAEYQRVRGLAWAEYERVSGPAWAEYERVCESACATLRTVLAQECPDVAWGPNGLIFPASEAPRE